MVKYSEPGYLPDILVPLVRNSKVELRSSDDPFCMNAPTALGGFSFASRPSLVLHRDV